MRKNSQSMRSQISSTRQEVSHSGDDSIFASRRCLDICYMYVSIDIRSILLQTRMTSLPFPDVSLSSSDVTTVKSSLYISTSSPRVSVLSLAPIHRFLSSATESETDTVAGALNQFQLNIRKC